MRHAPLVVERAAATTTVLMAVDDGTAGLEAAVVGAKGLVVEHEHVSSDDHAACRA